MPHQCTNCGRTFPDGSKEMLSGCPDCGGNKFQFAPSSTADAGAADTPQDDSRTPPERPTGESADSVAARAAESVRDFVSTGSDSSSSETRGSDKHGEKSAETDVSGQQAVDVEAGPKTESGTPSQKPTADEPIQNADDNPTQNAKTDDTAQNTVSDWTTASESDDVPSSSGEFPEWPDSARPPEDRSTSPTKDPSTATSSSDDTAVPSGVSDATSVSDSSLESQDSADSSGDTGGDQPRLAESTTAESKTAEPTQPERVETEPIDSEDTAQASARSDVVQTDELPDSAEPIEDATAPDHGRVVSEPTGEQPSLEELRAELNEQFESIKILKPGQYELNLMELYNREEYIISLQEDGRYVIDVPDSWRDGDEE